MGEYGQQFSLEDESKCRASSTDLCVSLGTRGKSRQNHSFVLIEKFWERSSVYRVSQSDPTKRVKRTLNEEFRTLRVVAAWCPSLHAHNKSHDGHPIIAGTARSRDGLEA